MTLKLTAAIPADGLWHGADTWALPLTLQPAPGSGWVGLTLGFPYKFLNDLKITWRSSHAVGSTPLV